MEIEENFPLYMMIDEEPGDVLVVAEGVEGFFVDPEEELPEVAFLGARRVGKRGRVESAVLDILNRRQEKIGEYFIGRVVLEGVGAESSGDEKSRISCRYFGNRCEYPGAGRIWQRWASGVVLEKGEWLQWPASQHAAWLHVVQNSWFAANRSAARYGLDEVALLDGAQVSTRSGFFCALGEAVNGPGGYFGSNLDALADCISSEVGEGPLAKIVWRNFRASRESLDRDFLNSIMGVMREFDVDLVLC
ncbi:barstar family protein [Micromonospora echinospora]|uniref:barstar family protein n=1 Tax=Micromonospora echinospora TaxID=1877 RepID=UPI003A890916